MCYASKYLKAVHYLSILLILWHNLDSTCVLIGQQVCFHSAMKHKNDVSDMFCCLQVVGIYSFIKKKLHICAFYIVFLFVKSENNNFRKINKTCSPCLHSLVKTSVGKFVRILEQVETFGCVSGFHWSVLQFSELFASVSPGYEGTENTFYFLNIDNIFAHLF